MPTNYLWCVNIYFSHRITEYYCRLLQHHPPSMTRWSAYSRWPETACHSGSPKRIPTFLGREPKNEDYNAFEVQGECTKVQNSQKSRHKYEVTCLFVRMFVRFLAHSLTLELMGKWMIRWLFFLYFFLIWTIVEWGARGVISMLYTEFLEE